MEPRVYPSPHFIRCHTGTPQAHILPITTNVSDIKPRIAVYTAGTAIHRAGRVNRHWRSNMTPVPPS